MPADGLCTDLTCDKEIKHLYECHCCLSLICFHHLSEHVQVTQRNKERLVSLRNELKTVVGTLIVIVEKKSLNIEREKNLTEQAQKLLDVENGSIDEVQIIFEEIKEAIALSQLEEIIKLEPILSNTKTCSCICKCRNQNDEFLSKTTSSPSSRSLVYLNSTDKSMMTTDDEYSMSDSSVIVDCNSLDRTTVTIEDSDDDNEQNEMKSRPLSGLRGLCPLTVNGAFGLTTANHSMRFCSKKKPRSLVLYFHFLGKHRLKPVYARRLLKAISNNEDPKTTKLFNKNEGVINHLCKIPCPCSKNMIHLFRGSTKDMHRVPCHYSRMSARILLHHLQYYHHVTENVAQTLVNQSKEIEMEKLN
ncbi:unnamed protein product [Adineta steineri]|uniref:Uncharacterized protein n=1 Tax=Adineta steineri TaxID=433720 RepID=A0A814LI50_9BILA|nr:unnamed protein product [Adineta steineri]CAF1249606.1 unnamed protein product [Adineta steineri]CAF1381846.1 unnamed protein product [Adineta steineri]